MNTMLNEIGRKQKPQKHWILMPGSPSLRHASLKFSILMPVHLTKSIFI